MFYQSYQTGIETGKRAFAKEDIISYQSYQTGIETVQFDYIVPLDRYYQSYQTGIETPIPILQPLMWMTINRTKLELKRSSNKAISSTVSSYQSYQTGIET